MQLLMRFLSDNVVKLHFRQLNYSTAKLLGKLSLNWKNEFLDNQGAIFNFLVFVSRQELHYNVNNTFWYFLERQGGENAICYMLVI